MAVLETQLDGTKIRLTSEFFSSAGTAAPATGSGPAAPSKRREQVRHAQRYVFSTWFLLHYHAYLFLSPTSHSLPITLMITYI